MISFITGFGSDFSMKATALFTAQVYLQGGTIFAEGYGQINPNGPSKNTFPILGGTGKYDNVRGYVNVVTSATATATRRTSSSTCCPSPDHDSAPAPLPPPESGGWRSSPAPVFGNVTRAAGDGAWDKVASCMW